jgi:hypothetical protein
MYLPLGFKGLRKTAIWHDSCSSIYFFKFPYQNDVAWTSEARPDPGLLKHKYLSYHRLRMSHIRRTTYSVLDFTLVLFKALKFLKLERITTFQTMDLPLSSGKRGGGAGRRLFCWTADRSEIVRFQVLTAASTNITTFWAISSSLW